MRQLIAGNWKMHGLTVQLPVIEAICRASARSPADILICPPFTLIARAAEIAAGRIAIGGQDCAITETGPCTGDVSAEMLTDAGATAVILGHSERRHHHGETDQVVFAKAQAATELGVQTIICIGETQSQRSAGTALTVCAEQIAASVPSQSESSRLVIGYEPLWGDRFRSFTLCRRDRRSPSAYTGLSDRAYRCRGDQCSHSLWRLRQSI